MADKSAGQGSKTHEQFLRTIQRKDDMPKPDDGPERDAAAAQTRTPRRPEARRSDIAVSRGGMHQESRDHNKHNHPGQNGHKPQKHGPAEEKH